MRFFLNAQQTPKRNKYTFRKSIETKLKRCNNSTELSRSENCETILASAQL